jgi:hypothetical protein
MFSTENHIRQLCNKAIAAPDDRALERALSELKAAIQVHIYKTRVMAATEIPRAFKRVKEAA